ncbi:hypothetical protein [Caldilinea sp.]|uniref:hypothetical protein n=1 Tax=Caldilinea sp. TaxID=2293560 RepID=UPI0021DC6976|nr:hypothetical protein [Caldilinea sp.]GIV67701.1 MAG: hypothetical protein KatS3mg048_0563 [Caldilinea sp.]
MTENFVEFAKSQMGAVERLLKGLPGVKGYIDKELRRDADKRVRDAIAASLEQSKAALTAAQSALLKSGGLAKMADVNEAIVALQTLADRVKTATYGYAGFFDPVRIKEEQLDALVRFDRSLAQKVGAINEQIAALAQAVKDRADIGPALDRLNQTIAELNALFSKRSQAIETPGLLDDPNFAPSVDAGGETSDASGASSSTNG